MDELVSHPLVAAARTLADTLLAPQAADVDVSTVPRSHLDALGAAGLLGLGAPSRVGGSEAPRPVVRAVAELLAGADLATWFVQLQHHGPVRSLVTASGPDGERPGAFDDALRRLACGDLVAGIAVSHLRRFPDRPVTVARDGDAWRFDGTAPWYTGWGLNDVLLLSGVDDGGRVVHALVDAVASDALEPSARMRVAALEAASTVTLTLRGLRVPAERIVATERIEDWQAADDLLTVNVNPAVLGLTGSALDLLAVQGERRGEKEAVRAAQRMQARLRAVRDEAYGLMDDVAPAEGTQQRLAVRSQAHRLMVEATTALVICGAGASMAAGSAAQRKAREGLFLLVQGQTRAARLAALDAWGP